MTLAPDSPGPAPATQAACSRHPNERAIEPCCRCGDYVCLVCARYVAGQAFCPHCAPPDLPRARPGTRLLGQLADNLLYGAAGVVGLVVGMGIDNQAAGLWLAVAFLLSVFGLNMYLLVSSGQSLGKRAVGTRIVTTEGGPVPLVRMLVLRNVLPTMLSVVPGIGGLFGLVDALWIFGQETRCVHDMMAGTIVVDAAASARVYPSRA